MNWTCPYCDRAQTITETRIAREGRALNIGDNKLGHIGFEAIAIACANAECNEVTLIGELVNLDRSANYYNQWANISDAKKFLIERFKLRPASKSKYQPDYIPAPLREDYYEACAIRDLSPKASATLARRCIQGMIRDFCKISKARLIDEVKALRAAIDNGTAPPGVTAESVEAIDSVRSVGNIGAHMEKDIGIIIDVDPDEAQILIELVELLFVDWYVARHARQDRLARVNALSASKKSELEAARLAALTGPTG